jgi:hypothetical protein
MGNRRKRNADPKQSNEGRPTYLVNLGQNPHGSGPGPTYNRHAGGGRGEATPRCGSTQGALAPLHAGTASPFHVASPGGSPMADAYRIMWNIPPNRPFHSYKKDGDASSYHQRKRETM